MKRRDFFIQSTKLTLGAGVALSVPSFLFGVASSKEVALTIYGAPALISLSLAVAVQQGKAKEIMPLKFDVWKTPDQLRAGFSSGDFILSAAPSNVGVNMANQGLGVKMLNILTNGLNYIFTKDSALNSLKSLEGKSVILPFKNDLPDIVLQALCKELGVDLSSMKLTYVQTPPEAVKMFLSKKEYDAVLTQEPMASALLKMSKMKGVNAYRSIDVQKLWESTFTQCPKIPQAGLIVKSEFYENNKEFFAVLHNDLQEAITWIKSNPKEAAKIGSKYLPVPKFAIESGIAYSYLVVEKCSDRVKELNSFFEIVYNLNPKLLGGKMPENSLYL